MLITLSLKIELYALTGLEFAPTSATTSTTTHTIPTTSTQLPCQPIHLTRYLREGDNFITVNIPGKALVLPPGDFKFTSDYNGQSCEWFIKIKGKRLAEQSPKYSRSALIISVIEKGMTKKTLNGIWT